MGKAPVTLPGYGAVSLGPELGMSESAMANRCQQLGIGGSSRQQQDAQGLATVYGNHPILDSTVANEQLRNEPALNQQLNSLGFLAGLFPGTGGLRIGRRHGQNPRPQRT